MSRTERPVWVRAFSGVAFVVAWLQLPVAVAAYALGDAVPVVVVFASVAAAVVFIAVAVLAGRWEDKAG